MVTNSDGLSCEKAIQLAQAPDPAAFSSGGPATKPSSPNLEPWPSPEPPGNARIVMTGDDIGQWAAHGTSLTSLWMDLEDGMNVEIQGGSMSADRTQGIIDVSIIDQNTGDSAVVAQYGGGSYPTPEGVGEVTLTDVSGSFADRDMLISFSYPGGKGTLDPVRAKFILN
jgi:hypothetical protein